MNKFRTKASSSLGLTPSDFRIFNQPEPAQQDFTKLLDKLLKEKAALVFRLAQIDALQAKLEGSGGGQ